MNLRKIKHNLIHSFVVAPKKQICSGCCTKLIGMSVTLAGKKILEDINLHFHCGEMTVIIGPNGAGKSTLLKAIIGEIPYKGELCFHLENDQHPQTPRIGYLPQKLDFDLTTTLTVADLFKISSPKIKSSEIDRALKMAEASEYKNKKLGSLSGGELQRVLLSLSLTPLPDILLLDEPSTGLDPKGSELFYEIVSSLRENHDLSVLVVSHDPHKIAPYAERMIYLDKKILLDSTPNEVLSKMDSL